MAGKGHVMNIYPKQNILTTDTSHRNNRVLHLAFSLEGAHAENEQNDILILTLSKTFTPNGTCSTLTLQTRTDKVWRRYMENNTSCSYNLFVFCFQKNVWWHRNISTHKAHLKKKWNVALGIFFFSWCLIRDPNKMSTFSKRFYPKDRSPCICIFSGHNP